MEGLQFCVMITILYEFVDATQGGGCRSLDFLDCIENKALVNHTIASLEVLSPGLEQCQHQCYMNPSCVSYNLGPIIGWKRTCDLSDTDHVAFPSHVIPKLGFEYCAIKNPCSSNPCQVGTMCQPDFSADSYHCQACLKPLGLEDGTIPNSAITASSIFGPGKEPWRGRLKNIPAKPYNIHKDVGAWIARTPEEGEYLQIDLGRITAVTMVATQGRPERYDQWVTQYFIEYSSDGNQWTFYVENDRKKVFEGNADRNTVKTNILRNAIEARYVRIVALSWTKHIAMRVELYGCP